MSKKNTILANNYGDSLEKSRITIARKRKLMTLHLETVERAMGRRITQAEAQSDKFTQSRSDFVKLFTQWTEAE